jgi:membrane protease subunit HflC
VGVYDPNSSPVQPPRRRFSFRNPFSGLGARLSPSINTGKVSRALNLLLIAGVCLIVLVVAFNLCTFQVGMTEQAVVTRFGQVVKAIVPEKTPAIAQAIAQDPRLRGVTVMEGHGLFFKTPFIESVDKYLSNLLTYDTEPREVTTKDKKKLILDNFSQWRIQNPALFAISMKTEGNAHTRLDDIMYSKLNEEFGKVEAHVLIADKQYVLDMLQSVTERTNAEIAQYGMEVVDIRIKRTDLPTENSKNIYDRMKTERERQAKQYRSEGQEEAQKIRSYAERQAAVIEAEAYASAEQTKGEGDAEAARIYAEAYNRDPEFYEFYRTLQAYKEALKDNTKIVIDPKSDFARYLFGK